MLRSTPHSNDVWLSYLPHTRYPAACAKRTTRPLPLKRTEERDQVTLLFCGQFRTEHQIEELDCVV
jgi:hypothetical protein